MRMAPLRATGRHGGDALSRLTRTLTASATAAGCDVPSVVVDASRPWASATFVGAQHAVTLLAPRSPGLGGWVAALPDAELPLRGHVVASLAVERIEDDGVQVILTVEVLTLEAA